MELLKEVTHSIEAHKLELERSIRNIRLLFKPWPSEEAKEFPKNDQVPTKSTDATCVGGIRLTETEQQGVDLVDKLLHKAQRARDVQNKLEEPKRPRNKIETSQKLKEETQTITGCHDNVNNEMTSNITSTKTKDVSIKRTPANPKTDVLKPVPVNSNNHIKTNISTKSIGEKRTTVGSRISERPHSSRGRNVPAHVNAPFQTNPRLATTKLQTTSRAASSKTQAQIRKQTSYPSATNKGHNIGGLTRGSSSVASAKGDKSTTTTNTRQVNVNQNSVLKKSSIVNKQQNQDIDINDGSTSEHSEQNSSGPSSISDRSSTSGSDRVEIDKVTDLKHDTATHTDTEQSPETSTGEKQFKLEVDGQTLSVPTKLKKLAYNNRKLRQKVFTKNVTKKVDTPPSDTEFPSHIEHAFGDSDVLQVQIQAKQARHVLQVYTNLSQILDSLHLDHISVDSPTKDVVRAKKILEYLLLTFHETEQMMITADFSLLSMCETSPVDVGHIAGPQDYTGLSVWYKAAGLLPGNESVTAYRYQSYKQLERYMDLIYSIQLQQLQIHVMDATAAVVVPLLKTLHPTSSEFIQLLRSSYSMLSTNPNRVPVVVKDTIQDVSVMEDDVEDT